jgi:hypothetical protein
VGGTRHGRRVTMNEAAEILGVSVEAIRKRVQRDSIRSDKGPDGRRYVYLDEAQESEPQAGVEGRELIDELHDRVRSLEEQLREERRANDENRRLLAAALERIPAIEPPRDTEKPSNAPERAAEEPERAEPLSSTPGPQERVTRPWWRRVFGG